MNQSTHSIHISTIPNHLSTSSIYLSLYTLLTTNQSTLHIY